MSTSPTIQPDAASQTSSSEVSLSSSVEKLAASVSAVKNAIDQLQISIDQLHPDAGASASPSTHIPDVTTEETPGSNVSTSVPTLSSESTKYYAVLVGRSLGVFIGPIPGGQAIKCDTEQEVKAVFDAALDMGQVSRVRYIVSSVVMTRSDFPTGTYRSS
ncbi:hypothetical protein CPC08DRAFT_731181 [Agrocybe pediades]|nr:hypothetical protein CPC08DRAFT_731181 [Agrocybe pediades]